jgi:leucyl aminopeptidase
VPAPETAKAMRLDVLESPLSSARVDCVVAGLHEGDELPASTALLDRAARGRMKALAARGDLPTRLGETLLLVDVEGVRAPRVVVVGLGPRKGFDRRAWRKAVGAAFAALLRTRATSAALAIDLPDGVAPDAYYFGRAIAELLGAALYRTNDRKSGRKPRAPVLARLLAGPVASDGVAAARRGLAHGQAVAGGMNLLRDLGNLPGNVCTPRYLATQARELAREQRDLKVKVLEEADLKRLKMGCLLAVSRGSAEPPRLVVVEYRGGRAGAAPVVLVGKGVTFDTGGISLKDPGAMDEMKYDMCGAASVLAAISVAARLKLPLNVVALMPAVENMPSSTATKPGDIVTSAAGQTVEILNTDAEGRLILCDALHYARRFDPDCVIDVATLTGACVIALGHHFTGVMGNDDALARELVDAGTRADDRAWQLPLTEDYAEQLKSNFADLANVGGRDGGAITAGAFLGRFATGLKWAHLDIAGTAWLSGAQKGGTGRPLPLLADFLIQRAGRRP